MIKFIEGHSLAKHATALANYLPSGKLWAAKNIPSTNFRNLLQGLAAEILNAEAYLEELQNDFLPDTTIKFIDEWERAVGIPDTCFLGTGDIDERRSHILVKLASLGVQTADDFIALAALFGTEVDNVVGGKDILVSPVITPDKTARFTIVVIFNTTGSDTFPFTFPITFGNDTIALLECLFSKLKPANCQVIFQQD